ncbi:MAG: hypothetical protein ABH863_00580 [Candidatus Micrarchaeota archaeon]
MRPPTLKSEFASAPAACALTLSTTTFSTAPSKKSLLILNAEKPYCLILMGVATLSANTDSGATNRACSLRRLSAETKQLSDSDMSADESIASAFILFNP